MAEATFVQNGDSIDYTPGVDVAAGQIVVLSELIGIAKTPISANELGALATEGVFDVAKEGGVAVTFAIGDLAYWDDTNKFAVATDGGGANKLLGKAVKAAADAETNVRIRIG